MTSNPQSTPTAPRRLALITQESRIGRQWAEALERAFPPGLLQALPLSPSDPLPSCDAGLSLLREGDDLALFLNTLRLLRLHQPVSRLLVLADEAHRETLEGLQPRLAANEILFLPVSPETVLETLAWPVPETSAPLSEQMVQPSTPSSTEGSPGGPLTERQLMAADLSLLTLLPERVARLLPCLLLDRRHSVLFAAVPDPDDLRVLDHLRDLLGEPVSGLPARAEDLLPCIDRLYSRLSSRRSAQDLAGKDSLTSSEERAQGLLDLILEGALQEGATDIHIEPAENELVVRSRIERRLQRVLGAPMALHATLLQRLRLLAGLEATAVPPLEGRFRHAGARGSTSFLLSLLPTRLGDKAVLIPVSGEDEEASLASLGFPAHDLAMLQRFLQVPYGMVLLAGYAGPSKTAFRRALMRELVSERIHVVSLESGAQGHLPGVTQVPLGRGLDALHALQALERQDVDAVFLEDLPSGEVADAAAKFALTGRLVFAGVHAPDSAAGLARLLESGGSPVLLGSAINLSIAGATLKRLCPACRLPVTPPSETRQALGLSLGTGDKFFQAGGCTTCNGTGTAGTLPVFELLPISGALRRLLFRQADLAALRAEAQQGGQQSLVAAGIERARQGLCPLEQVMTLLS